MTAARIRAGDSDRQQSVDRLARHFTDGRLDSGEYDERVRRAYASVYLDELPPLFSDLPAEPVRLSSADNVWPQGGRPVARRAAHGYGVLAHVQGARRIAAFALLAALVWIMVVSHGLFLFPLLWLGFGLNTSRRKHRRGGRW